MKVAEVAEELCKRIPINLFTGLQLRSRLDAKDKLEDSNRRTVYKMISVSSYVFFFIIRVNSRYSGITSLFTRPTSDESTPQRFS